MNKNCILTAGKICNNCDECNRCDMDKNKICDNCGKCLNVGEASYKKVDIDEIDDLNFNEYDYESNEELLSNLAEEENIDEDYMIDYIDDIDGLSDLIDDAESKSIEEVYPGLFKFKSSDN